MKKLFMIVMIAAMALVICACGKPDLDVAINKPLVSSDGVELTLTSMKSDAVMTPNFDVINTFEFEVKAINNTGNENELYNIYNSMELYGPDGKEVDKNISGPGYVMTGYTTQMDKQYESGKVLDGGFKEYTVAMPDPGADGEYTLMFMHGDYQYKFYFSVEHLSKEKGGTTITYPTLDGEAVYQSWPTK